MRKPLPKDILDKINSYRNKDLNELRNIKARWAEGNQRLHPTRPGAQPCYVNIEYLIEHADFGEMMKMPLEPKNFFNGVDERDFRVVKILDHWSNGGMVDPPDITIDRFNQISFGDGRHRTVTAFHLGEKEIPVIIYLNEI